MQGSNQAYEKNTQAGEEVLLGFKQLILEQTQAFEQTPKADLYRVQLLALMLERYDNYTANGAQAEAACQYVVNEFSNLHERMQAEGFKERVKRERSASALPLLSESEAMTYIKQSAAHSRRRSIGFITCFAAIVPFTIIEFIKVLHQIRGDSMLILENCCTVIIIALGIFLMVTAKKPELNRQIRKKRFLLSKKLREKLNERKAEMSQKASDRKKAGFLLMLVTILAGGISYAFGDMYLGNEYLATLICMLMTCSTSCVWLYMFLRADAEKKAIHKLLKGRTNE